MSIKIGADLLEKDLFPPLLFGRFRFLPTQRVGAYIVCKAKECGGLGLKRLTSWNKVFALKLIWLLFTKAGSLWVSWVRINLIGNRNFWTLNPYYSGSWIWRKLCKLRSVARPFVICEIGSGVTASFWQDNWTGLGPLIDLTGPTGSQVIGLPLKAVVREVLGSNGWRVTNSRSRNPVISLLRSALPEVGNMRECVDDDVFLWKTDHHPPSCLFSSPKTWLALNPLDNSVAWHKSVWFKDRIPKHAFICWVVAWNRLHTRDRLTSWGLSVSPLCVLCNACHESRDHLVFECVFSQEVWKFFTSRANLTPPSSFMASLLWIKTASRDSNLSLILKLIFQAAIYLLWKERNSRIHSSTTRPPASIIRDISMTLRARLDPLSRIQLASAPGSSLLSTWFRFFG
ncbi:uncharacterized protein LOC110224415 [Arabidopsis lyrata subsp. lyrata]|uniref:uncharacterized protein LOC110224415 n=1 Tax=Arabidopsis lyrata subsp. lyrata TaxID=81972 RepID=UPI000A29BF2A|nr:uncharacterized protein LOC110224415 [Arabidopsis lyrata subsp. lyrata]|eukprot:XP_020866133.1 uncharacterized protein LOC110224415 [Arabidopsis lyrata subsp. lyrata]